MNLLAVVGAIALVGVVALGVWFWRQSEPAGEPAAPPPTAATPAAPSGDLTPPGGIGAGEVWAAGSRLESARVDTEAGEIADVVITAEGVHAGQEGAQAGSVEATARVPFTTVERQVGNGIRLAHDGSGSVRATAPFTVLGRTLHVSGTGEVRPDGEYLLVVPGSLDTPGPDVIGDAIGAAARAAITVREPISGLPEGMLLTGIRVLDDGFHVQLQGDQVALAPR